MMFRTDKVSVEVTSPNSGYISEIKTEVGETVEVGSQLGSISQSQSKNTTNIEKEVVTRKAKKSEDIKPKRSEPANNNVVKLKTEVKKDELSPAVKRIVEERRIDLSQIQGSGKDGRILKSDLITLMGEKPVPPIPPKLDIVNVEPVISSFINFLSRALIEISMIFSAICPIFKLFTSLMTGTTNP